MNINELVLQSLREQKTQAIYIQMHQSKLGNELNIKQIYSSLQRLSKQKKQFMKMGYGE